jgi:predicted enzyme related to lactoylglutathione lyase
MPNLTRVAPELPVNDMAEALEYYEQQLAFAVVMTMSAGEYAIVERDGVALHLFHDDSGVRSPGSIHIFASGLDDLAEELRGRGAQVTQQIVRQPWGNRDFRVADPAGNTIKFTEPLADGS